MLKHMGKLFIFIPIQLFKFFFLFFYFISYLSISFLLSNTSLSEKFRLLVTIKIILNKTKQSLICSKILLSRHPPAHRPPLAACYGSHQILNIGACIPGS